MKVVFDHSEEIVQNIRTFWFKPNHKIRYIAGQFIELRIPHEDRDSRRDKRWFTLSSSPTDELLSITTKFAGETSSSFKNALFNLEPGTQLHMASPMGDFVLPKDASIPLIFVAGGIGCTPFHSIVKYLSDSGEKRDVTLLYAASSDEEVAFRPDFRALGDKFITIVGERLTVEKILDHYNKDQYIYLSGPEPMVEVLDKGLKQKGVDKKHIRTDFFPGYKDEYSK